MIRKLLLTSALSLTLALIATPAFASGLLVDPTTGAVTWFNNTESSIQVAGYSIESALGTLNSANWTNISDNYDSDSGGSFDPDDNWFSFTPFDTLLGEGTLGTETLMPGESVFLGDDLWDQSTQDLEFSYLDEFNQTVLGTVDYISVSFNADFDSDGDIDGSDFLIWQSNFGMLTGATLSDGDADGDGKVGAVDFGIWKTQYGTESESGNGGLLSSGQSVPEPSSLLIVFLGSLMLVLSRVRNKNR